MTRPTGQLDLGPLLDEVVPSTAELIAPNGGDSVALTALELLNRHTPVFVVHSSSGRIRAFCGLGAVACVAGR